MYGAEDFIDEALIWIVAGYSLTTIIETGSLLKTIPLPLI
jgi:hypothetical protein